MRIGRRAVLGTLAAGPALAQAEYPGRPVRLVSRAGVVDGPFTEAKEVIGGYWFVVAASLQEAAALVAQNPCLACGLLCEIRPIELAQATADALSNETPPASARL